MTAKSSYKKEMKIRSKGWWRGHVTYFYNVGTPSISRERYHESRMVSLIG